METSHEPLSIPPSPDPSPSTFEALIDDVDDFARLFPGWTGRFQQISAGRFDGGIQIIEGRLIRLFRAKTNQILLTRGVGRPGWIDVVPVTPRNQKSLWQGRYADPNHVIIRGDHVGVDNLAARDAEIITFSIPNELMKRVASNALPSDTDFDQIHWGCNYIEMCDFALLEGIANEIIRSAMFNPAYLLSTDCLAREQECLLAAMRAIDSPLSSKRRRPRRGNRAEIARKGDEYLRHHLTSPVGLIDLCDELGASARTVQYAFRERFGIGPIEYLRILRLDSARLDLKSARQTGRKIREIAASWGFIHMGNFAYDYRKHFGELPSHTAKLRSRPTAR